MSAPLPNALLPSTDGGAIVAERPAAPSPDELRMAVGSLVHARLEAEALAQEYTQRRQAFEASLGDLPARLRTASEQATMLEEGCRRLALQHYAATDDKHPFPGLEVKVFDKLVYDDALAFEFCTKVGQFVIPASFDRRGFEKLARASGLSFVQKIDEARALIASDLVAKWAPAAQDACA